jgi:hypothetical protein
MLRRLAQLFDWALGRREIVGALAALLALATPWPRTARSQPASGDLAFARAPIHYQDTDSTNYRADYIARVNYDGNWRADDNWEHLQRSPLFAHAYSSIVETCTHWFIVYAFYHPRDWSDTPFDQEHENDLEGFLAIVRKDGSPIGRLEGIVTVFHDDFFSYTPSGSPLRDGQEDIDGRLTLRMHEGVSRPLTVQQAKGHGLKAWPFAGDFRGRQDEDGIIYYPSRTLSEVPQSGNDRVVRYRLIDVFAPGGLWDHQLREAGLSRGSAETFAAWGTFKGDEGGGCGSGTKTCKEDAAHAPWGWDDHDDGPVYGGEVALDPAHVTSVYFDGLRSFSTRYVRNRYLVDLRARGYGPGRVPRGWPSHLDLGRMLDRLTTGCP